MNSIKLVPSLGHVDTITIIYASTQGTSRAFADRLARGLQESDLTELADTPAIKVRDARLPEVSRIWLRRLLFAD